MRLLLLRTAIVKVHPQKDEDQQSRQGDHRFNHVFLILVSLMIINIGP